MSTADARSLQELWESGFALGARGDRFTSGEAHVTPPYRRAYGAGYDAGRAALKQALRDWKDAARTEMEGKS